MVGACDIYAIKAAGRDKKLYKDIENTLETQHSSWLRISKSLSPPDRELLHLEISQRSPFGPMDKNSSRRTYAYLIATMNASHPDYDFSEAAKPYDFKKELNLMAVMRKLDDTMYNLRPKMKTQMMAPLTKDASVAPNTPGGTPAWSTRAWKAIDKEMCLRECDIYRYDPEEDPFDGDDSAIWSYHYFFYNKKRKRVLYLYVRGSSILSHSPTRIITTVPKIKRPRPPSSQSLTMTDAGASKRAKYWLGDRFDSLEDGWKYHDDEEETIEEPGDDEVDVVDAIGSESFEAYDDTDADEVEACLRSKKAVQGMNEQIADSIDL